MDGTGNWILTEDINLNATRTTGNGHLRIDLNGHNIYRYIDENDETALVFNVTDPKTTDSVIPTLTITDTSTEGVAGVVGVKVNEGITPKFSNGVAVYVGSGSCTLAGRAILDGSNLTSTKTSGAATVQVNNAGESFIMLGGTVKSLAATGTSSGAINGWGGSTIVIHGGEVTSAGTEELAVYAGGDFTMDGGKIVGGLKLGTATTATGVITFGGTAEIDKVNLMGCTSCTFTGAAKIGEFTNTSGKTPVEDNFTGTIGG